MSTKGPVYSKPMVYLLFFKSIAKKLSLSFEPLDLLDFRLLTNELVSYKKI